jgi:hypothetical protein
MVGGVVLTQSFVARERRTGLLHREASQTTNSLSKKREKSPDQIISDFKLQIADFSNSI